MEEVVMAPQVATQVVSERVVDAQLDSWPLATDQVIAGDPQAHGKLLWKSDDGTLANGIWQCTPGTFRWTHANETACVVQGRATITPEGGEPFTLAAGDLVFFPEGTKTEWRVEETLRKAFHLHSAGGLGL
jgi:uncharacterized protein